MLIADFDYELPDDRIAQTPIEPRDAARLLVDRGSGAPEHRHVRDLPELLREGDLLVLNETRVIPARLRLRRPTGGAAEVLLLEPWDADRRTWEALVRPGGKLAVGEVLLDGDVPLVRMGERTPAGDTFWVELVGDDDPVVLLDRHGEMPLPPYICERLGDPDRYQTVFAREPGSAAAPTAGLHFTAELFDRLARARHLDRDGRTRRRASTRSSRSAPTIRSIIRCTPSATGCRPRRWKRAATPSGSLRSAPRRFVRSSRLPGPVSCPVVPICSSTEASTGSWST